MAACTSAELQELRLGCRSREVLIVQKLRHMGDRCRPVFDRLCERLNQPDHMVGGEAFPMVRGEAHQERLGERKMRDQRQVLFGRRFQGSSVTRASERVSVFEDVVDQEVPDQLRVPVEQRAGVMAVGALEGVGDLRVCKSRGALGFASKAGLEALDQGEEGRGHWHFGEADANDLGCVAQLQRGIG